MRIIGVPNPLGTPVVEFTVGHGEHPVGSLFLRGYVPISPLAATLTRGEIVVTYLVRARTPGDRRPRSRTFSHEEPLTTQVPAVRQRVGAYAVVTSSLGVLGTVNSSLTGAPGTWALPGGGVDDDEAPSDAVIREVFEESGQHVTLDRILAVDSDHWIGRSTTGVLEDFHALRIIYAATCETPSEPIVHDRGGSTERAGWVPLQSWNRLRWTISSRTVLSTYCPRAQA